MVIGRREFVVGLVRDLLFGPVVMFGLGGIYTEALTDVAFAVAPVSEDDAYELMDADPGEGAPWVRYEGSRRWIARRWRRSSWRWGRWRRTIPRSAR